MMNCVDLTLCTSFATSAFKTIASQFTSTLLEYYGGDEVARSLFDGLKAEAEVKEEIKAEIKMEANKEEVSPSEEETVSEEVPFKVENLKPKSSCSSPFVTPRLVRQERSPKKNHNSSIHRSDVDMSLDEIIRRDLMFRKQHGKYY